MNEKIFMNACSGDIKNYFRQKQPKQDF